MESLDPSSTEACGETDLPVEHEMKESVQGKHVGDEVLSSLEDATFTQASKSSKSDDMEEEEKMESTEMSTGDAADKIVPSQVVREVEKMESLHIPIGDPEDASSNSQPEEKEVEQTKSLETDVSNEPRAIRIEEEQNQSSQLSAEVAADKNNDPPHLEEEAEEMESSKISTSILEDENITRKTEEEHMESVQTPAEVEAKKRCEPQLGEDEKHLESLQTPPGGVLVEHTDSQVPKEAEQTECLQVPSEAVEKVSSGSRKEEDKVEGVESFTIPVEEVDAFGGVARESPTTEVAEEGIEQIESLQEPSDLENKSASSLLVESGKDETQGNTNMPDEIADVTASISEKTIDKEETDGVQKEEDVALQNTDDKVESGKPNEDCGLPRDEPNDKDEPMEVEEGVQGLPLQEDTTEVLTTSEDAAETKSPIEEVGNDGENEPVSMDIDKEKPEDGKISRSSDIKLDTESKSAEPLKQLTEETNKKIEIESTKDLTAGDLASPMDTSSKSPASDISGESKTMTKAVSAEKRGKTASKGFNLGNIVSRLLTQMESKKEEVEGTEGKKDTVDIVPEKTQSKRSEQKQMRAAAQAAMMMYEDTEFDEEEENKTESSSQTGEKQEKNVTSYASNSMDDLLGLYGYNKLDSKETANLQQSSSLTQSKTPITGSVGNLKPNQKINQTLKPIQGETGLVISNVTSMAPGQKVVDSVVGEALRKKITYCTECSAIVNDDVSLISSGHSFCTQACQDKYQNRQTLVCDYCSGMITQGADKKFVRETRVGQKKFCSQTCSEEFSKRVRNCNTCGEEISKASEGILAPVGVGGKFLDFCKQECVNNYGKKPAVTKQLPAKSDGSQPRYWSQETFFVCAVCSNYTKAKHVISLQGKLNGLCSTECFTQFKEKNQLAFSLCSQCSALCSNQKMMRSIEIEGKINRFCSMRCFKMKLKRSMSTIPCAACKKPNWAQNMIEEWNGTELVRFFCSTACLGKREIIPFTGSAPKTVPVSKTVMAAQSIKTTPMAIKQHNPPQTVPMATQGNITRITTPAGNKCDHCSKQQRPLYHLTMSDNSIRNFCSYACVIAFQAQFNVPPVTLPQETLQLTCSQCQTGFSTKPLALDFKGVVNVFCAQNCLDEFKRVNSVVVECDYCHLEKILHECIYFSGQARSFCSEGCKLLFKQQFAQRLGLRCTVCDYCAQTCRSRAEQMYGNVKKKFCSTACRTQYDKWLSKGAKCDGCKCTGRKLEENFMWRGEMKRVCNQHCLLLFYTQQNIPNMHTQTQSTIPAIQLTQVAPKTTTPVITNVMSLAPGQQQTGSPANNLQYQPKAITQNTELPKKCHKQTQITTAPPKVMRPPPPPMPLPPAPKMVKNKVTLVKPFTQTKSVSCRPLTASKKTMTDEQHPMIIPVPVPIYIPVPMHMYTTPVPHPLSFPVPVPVPLFLPVAHNNAERLLATMKEIIQKFPSDPLEAEMLMLADAIAGDSGSSKNDQASKTDEGLKDMAGILATDEVDRDDLSSLTIDEMEDMSASTLMADNILKMAADIAHVLDDDPITDLQDDLNSLEAVEEPKTEQQPRTTRSRSGRASGRRGRSRGNKRSCIEEPSTPEPEDPPLQAKRSKEESRVSVGVNAYRYFVSQKKNTPEGKELKHLTFNPNTLEVNMEELIYILCLMCKEAKRPDGDKYTPDVLHLIFLSIQQHLSDNDRPENIFTDQVYRRFTDLLHDEIKTWVVERNPIMGVISNSCINEETLWNSKQLGAHSPYILLSTMIYFNTKHFQLKTLDQHKALALCRIQKHIRKTGPSRSMFLRYYPADRKKAVSEPLSKRKRERDPDADLTRLEQSENTENPLRCPVRLYEFYLSKCPDSVRSSSELFYLVPERSCVPDSPVWYSSAPLADHDMSKILTRMLMVTDIHDAWSEVNDDEDE